MTQAYIVPLRVDDVTQEDVSWLNHVLKDSEDGYDVDSILALASQGRCRIWRVVGDGTGILVTTLDAQPSGINCVVWFLAGKGLMRCVDSLFEQVSVYARAQGANAVIAHTNRKGLIELYISRLGMKPTATRLRKEI